MANDTNNESSTQELDAGVSDLANTNTTSSCEAEDPTKDDDADSEES